MLRNNPNVKIAGYSPEEYAGFWGGDPCYDRAPRLAGDGYLFYNFSSESIKRDAEWLANFAGAIERTIRLVNINPQNFNPGDAGELQQLLAHVRSLSPEA